MKLRKITQAEFDSFIINEYGIKECPTGDYSDFRSFAEWCSFAERCSFAEWCSFESRKVKVLQPYFIRINNIGSRGDGCIIFNFEDGIFVRSGCFFGSKSEFVKKVNETHSGTKYEKQYLTALELAKLTFQP